MVIPTYNRKSILPRAIDSVLAQRFVPHEIIVVDDGSTDGTAAWIRKTYPTVTLVEQDNCGVSAARNAAIALATGDWIAFLDSDDSWHPEKLLAQVNALREAPDAVLIHCDEIWVRNGKRVNPMNKHAKHGGWIFEKCLPLCAISPSAAMLHRRLFARGRYL